MADKDAPVPLDDWHQMTMIHQGPDNVRIYTDCVPIGKYQWVWRLRKLWRRLRGEQLFWATDVPRKKLEPAGSVTISWAPFLSEPVHSGEFKGVRVSNRPLTDEEMTALFEEGLPHD